MQRLLNLKSNEESNLFLRALCAEFRRQFGDCSWQYSPRKDGVHKYISFGFVKLKENPIIRVSISYKHKGVIDRIFFEEIFSPLSESSKAGILEAVDQALKTKDCPSIYKIETVFESSTIPLGIYSGLKFKVYAETDNLNHIVHETQGFDDIDALTEGLKYVKSILNFLAVCTNSCFTIISIDIVESEPLLNIEEHFYEDFDWIDSCPQISGSLAIWEAQKKFIDKILFQEIELIHPFFNASRHFHKAQKLEATHVILGENITDVTVVLYMSALESIANFVSSGDKVKSQVCQECGQQKYSIRQKVKALVRNHSNEHIESLVDEYYSMRSKYLHIGSALSHDNFLGKSIPQLNPESSTGCWMPYFMLPNNLKEFVSYILRGVFLKKLADHKLLS